MVTCHVRYIIDPYQVSAFERYSRAWISIVERLGGQHHGYFLPAEGANNVAYCLFSFATLPSTRGIAKQQHTIPNVYVWWKKRQR